MQLILLVVITVALVLVILREVGLTVRTFVTERSLREQIMRSVEMGQPVPEIVRIDHARCEKDWEDVAFTVGFWVAMVAAIAMH